MFVSSRGAPALAKSRRRRGSVGGLGGRAGRLSYDFMGNNNRPGQRLAQMVMLY
jgi:hypothetical protein